MSLVLSSCPCLYWQFTLTANSSPPTHGLLTISLTTVPGHFQSDLNAQTKYLIVQVLLLQTEIQDEQDEVTFLKGKCYCIISWRSKCPSAFRISSAQEFQHGHHQLPEPQAGRHLLQCRSTSHLSKRWVSLPKHLKWYLQVGFLQY